MSRVRLISLALPLLAAGMAAQAAAQPVVRLPGRDRPLAGRPAVLYSVGADEGRLEEVFASVEGVAFDRDENLYVLDGQNHRVVVFDREGRFVRQMGRRGDGPGELRFPAGLAVTADGRVAVKDAAHRRFTLFGRDGAMLGTAPAPQGSAAFMGGIAAHPRGGVLAALDPIAPLPGFPDPRRGEPGAPSLRGPGVVWYRLQAAAAPVTLFEASAERARPPRPQTYSAGGTRVTVVPGPPTFSPRLHWAVLPGGEVAAVHTERYHVRVVGDRGRTLRVLERPIAPRRVTARMREREREKERRRLTTGQGMVFLGEGASAPPRSSPGQAEEQARHMEFAPVLPVVRGLAAAPSGRLWIERTDPRDPEAPGPIDLVSASGTYLGTLRGERMPDAFGLGARAAYVETDELGVKRVVVKRLPAAWR